MSSKFFTSGGPALTSATDDWATPQAFFDDLNSKFHFVLDVCASSSNRKVASWYGLDHPDPKRRDGLTRDWAADSGKGPVWMNPPYGRGIGDWMHKAAKASDSGSTVVCLVPARTDTKWFHDTAFDRQVRGRAEVKFIRGRLKFGDGKNSAPFPSALVVFHP